jgi:hypothetical protein
VPSLSRAGIGRLRMGYHHNNMVFQFHASGIDCWARTKRQKSGEIDFARVRATLPGRFMHIDRFPFTNVIIDTGR